VAAPLVPPLPVEFADDGPDAPEVALPVDDDVDGPLSPAVALPVASPLLPVAAVEEVPPEPPPPWVEPDPDGLAVAEPVLPDIGLEVACPPLPVDDVDDGLEVACPVPPLVPEVADDPPLALPDDAVPVDDGFDVAGPVAPLWPLLPLVAAPVELP